MPVSAPRGGASAGRGGGLSEAAVEALIAEETSPLRVQVADVDSEVDALRAAVHADAHPAPILPVFSNARRRATWTIPAGRWTVEVLLHVYVAAPVAAVTQYPISVQFTGAFAQTVTGQVDDISVDGGATDIRALVDVVLLGETNLVANVSTSVAGATVEFENVLAGQNDVSLLAEKVVPTLLTELADTPTRAQIVADPGSVLTARSDGTLGLTEHGDYFLHDAGSSWSASSVSRGPTDSNNGDLYRYIGGIDTTLRITNPSGLIGHWRTLIQHAGPSGTVTVNNAANSAIGTLAAGEAAIALFDHTADQWRWISFGSASDPTVSDDFSATEIFSGTAKIGSSVDTNTYTVTLTEDYRTFDWLVFAVEGESDNSPSSTPKQLTQPLLVSAIPTAEDDRVSWLGGARGRRRPHFWGSRTDGTELSFKAYENAAANDSPFNVVKVWGIRGGPTAPPVNVSDPADRLWSAAFQRAQGRVSRAVAHDATNSSGVDATAAGNALDALPFTETVIPAGSSLAVEVAGRLGDLIQIVLLPDDDAAGDVTLTTRNADAFATVLQTSAALAATLRDGQLIELIATQSFDRVAIAAAAGGEVRVAAVRVLAEVDASDGGGDMMQATQYEFLGDAIDETTVDLMATMNIAHVGIGTLAVPTMPHTADRAVVTVAFDHGAGGAGTARLHYRIGTGNFPIVRDGANIDLGNGDSRQFELAEDEFDVGQLELTAREPNHGRLAGTFTVTVEWFFSGESFKRVFRHTLIGAGTTINTIENRFSVSRTAVTPHITTFDEPFRRSELKEIVFLYNIVNGSNPNTERIREVIQAEMLEHAGVIDATDTAQTGAFQTADRGRIGFVGWSVAARASLARLSNARLDQMITNGGAPLFVIAFRQSGAFVNGMMYAVWTPSANDHVQFQHMVAHLER